MNYARRAANTKRLPALLLRCVQRLSETPNAKIKLQRIVKGNAEADIFLQASLAREENTRAKINLVRLGREAESLSITAGQTYPEEIASVRP